MIENLSLREKIGQMLIVGLDSNIINERIKNLILNYKISGVILYRKNFNTYEDMVKLISELKQLNSKNKIPLFIAVDQEGGRVNRMPPEFHNLLSAYKLANTKNLDLVRTAGDVTGEMLSKSGFNMNFAPVLDILRKDTTESIGNRCFGENAEDVSKYGIETMKQLQKHKIVSVIKHFPGQGKARADAHFLLPTVKKIENQDTLPFQNAIKNGADIIMLGHLLVKDTSKIYPASLSKKMIRKLRLKYHFKGVIITDDLKMKAIKYIYGTKWAFKKAFYVGNDMVLFRFNKKEEIESIESVIKLVERGKIKQRRIDKSVKRVIELKKKYGLDDNSKIEKCNIEEINKKIDDINEFVNNYKKEIL